VEINNFSSIMGAKAFFLKKNIAMKMHFAGKQTHFFHIVTESP